MAPSTTCAALSDRGRVRETNEDAVLARPDAGLFAVADGMGGHRAGEVASAVAVEVLERLLADAAVQASAPSDPADGEARLRDALIEAGRAVVRGSREDPECRGMGTTATALLLVDDPDRWFVGHVGDSRAYLHREARLERLTRDHNLFPGSSTLTRALGAGEEPRPDTGHGPVREGDLFLLCTDGLCDQVDDERIGDLIGTHRDGGAADWVERAARALVEEANAAGGRDNVTVALVWVEG